MKYQTLEINRTMDDDLFTLLINGKVELTQATLTEIADYLRKKETDDD